MTQPRKRPARSSRAADEPARSSSRTRTNNRTASRPSPAQLARAAAEQLAEISGAELDCVSGLQRTDDGWLIQVEVVEVRRIPDATSVLASYQVVVDDDGMLQSYRRDHRYYRNQAGDV